MRYVEAPDRYDGSRSRWLARNPGEDVLFLGGGITGCPDWQAQVVKGLKNIESLAILNPRRENFPIDDPSAAAGQITWEYEHLRIANIIMFWFPKETVCPITLYELGTWTQRLATEHGFELILGVHPEYSRRLDVEVQTRLTLPNQTILQSIPAVIARIKSLF